MEFVKVRRDDGREADITLSEVPFYQSIGFDPVDGQVAAGDHISEQPVASTDPLIDEIKGLRSDLASIFIPGELIGEPGGELVAFHPDPDPRLDLILDELKAIRAALAPVSLEPQDGDPIELKEPAVLNLDGMTRDELNAHAVAIGINEPESFPNKPALLEAIRATEGAAGSQ
jgi:hypothetical protein